MNLTHDDILLSRILDGGSIDQQWREWAARADADVDASMWRRLACAQRDQLALVRAMNSAMAVADDSPSAPLIAASSQRAALPGTAAVPGPRHWVGWAVAAAVVVAAALWQIAMPAQHSAGTNPGAVQYAGWSPQQHLQHYVKLGQEQGSVVEELPQRVLLEARPSVTGIGYDVVFLRQIQEKMTVPDLYQKTGQDESGRAQLVSYEPQRGGAM